MRPFGFFSSIGLAVLLLFGDHPLRADETVPTVFATSWGETLAQDGTGFYNEIAGDVLARLDDLALPEALARSEILARPDMQARFGAKALYQIMPYRRAKRQFFKSKNSCLFPSSLRALHGGGEIPDPQNYSESNGLFTARTHLFVMAGNTPPKSLADLVGKTIAYPNGSVVNSLLAGTGAKLIGVTKEQDKARMLLSGRVDIITGMMPDTALVFASIGEKVPTFDPALALNKVPLTFVCHITPATTRFIASVNEALVVLADDTNYRQRLLDAKVVGLSGGKQAAPEALSAGVAPATTEPGAGVADQHKPVPNPDHTASGSPRSGRRLPIGGHY